MKISLDNGVSWQTVERLLVRHAYKEEFLEVVEGAKDSAEADEEVVVESKVELYFDFKEEEMSTDYWIDDECINTKVQSYIEIGDELGKE